MVVIIRREDMMLVACKFEDWHEDIGPVLWWKFPIEESPYVGTPLDQNWPGYHTHWTFFEIPGKGAEEQIPLEVPEMNLDLMKSVQEELRGWGITSQVELASRSLDIIRAIHLAGFGFVRLK
jgi:hypothetical protein